MPDTIVHASRLGFTAPNQPLPRAESGAALTAQRQALASLSATDLAVCASTGTDPVAFAAFKTKVDPDAALVASIPPADIAALRMFHVNDVHTLAAAWRATLEFRAGKAERERRASEEQHRVAASTPPMVCLSWRR